ncbi:MAG TPA: aspartate dehydrogenase [Methanomicrobia archaeon]|nr:aspartate dehydrogenase [Methanomicrobia archaeon]
MMKIGIIGCGYIGSMIAENFKKDVLACYDRNTERMDKLSHIVNRDIKCSFEEILKMDLDLVVESASIDAVRNLVPDLLKSGKDVMIMSVGALADHELFSTLKKIASENECRIYIPHGAVGGLDAVRSASLQGIEKIVLTTRKNPEALGMSVLKEKTVFEGYASEAIKKFPKNINVSVALSLASEKEVYVKIIADPSIETNIHEIYVKGAFGKMNLIFENLPSENKRTSILAALSAINLIRTLKSEIVIY